MDHLTPLAERVRSRRRAAAFSIVLGVVLLAAKTAAWMWTGSAAILSDALESIINVVAAGLAFYTIVQGAKPPDEEHPYGHGKAEDFSAGVEGALIVLAAGAILWHAVPRLFAPESLERLDLGLFVVLAAGAANGLAGAYLVRQGKAHHSQALVADGYHLLTDTITSAGVVVGLLLVRFTGWLWLDPLVAVGVALHILVAGLKLVRESVARLMDEADEELLDEIARRLEEHRRPGWIDVHQLRAWRTGDIPHVDLHLTMPRYWPIDRAHAEQSDLEEILLDPYAGRGELIVHVDPCKPECCSLCEIADCPVRGEEFVRKPRWTRELVTQPVELTRNPAFFED
jgi:cation diffusion facilitator family transporter